LIFRVADSLHQLPDTIRAMPAADFFRLAKTMDERRAGEIKLQAALAGYKLDE
jgi:hypothetical protein